MKYYAKSPKECGETAFYYRRTPIPHYYEPNTLSSLGVKMTNLTEDEVKEFWDGYHEYEKDNIQKVWDDWDV